MTQTPKDMLTAYVRAFETLRAAEVIPFYDLPCTFLRPDGLWVVQDTATALVLVEHLIEHATAQGYRRTEISALAVRTLAQGLVELSGVFVRQDASGAELDTFGFTYILRGGTDQWKIVVAVAHDARTETINLLAASDAPLGRDLSAGQ